MERLLGTIAYGLRAPIINNGDDVANIACDTILACQDNGHFKIENRDIFALTESVVARAQGNYATVEDIKQDINNKFGNNIENLGVVFPILSRNRFSLILRSCAMASKKVTVLFSYPSDEVGNHLVSLDMVDAAKVNPYSDVFNEKTWYETFGKQVHSFTGIDYIAFYKEIVEAEGAVFEAVFANDACEIIKHTNTIILADIHTRFRNYNKLSEIENVKVLRLDEILNAPINNSGYNASYGVLGSNKASDDSVKLFPRVDDDLVLQIQNKVFEKTNKKIEVLIYGDGAFKDPVGKIWELADPVVAVAYTEGLGGTPNEVKLKYLADNQFKDMSEEQQRTAITKAIKEKDAHLSGNMIAEGTTPRRITDLLGSLCDLISGSGDKGTPFVYIKAYFDNYSD